MLNSLLCYVVDVRGRRKQLPVVPSQERVIPFSCLYAGRRACSLSRARSFLGKVRSSSKAARVCSTAPACSSLVPGLHPAEAAHHAAPAPPARRSCTVAGRVAGGVPKETKGVVYILCPRERDMSLRSSLLYTHHHLPRAQFLF